MEDPPLLEQTKPRYKNLGQTMDRNYSTDWIAPLPKAAPHNNTGLQHLVL